ncbi:hypothetical protein KIN20_017167 [Parelaphostrongylus tenuis]|uniref:UFSP N-terminal MPN domain-containing protein n=1 Tax=Parelaphostrongylus tenuis TaxID=148309 RepID=A0AAD5N2A1_PARTN|nr:hypothetical protein KIN20_017167 [Parelaphostrongylus tenuis]
MDDKHGTHVPDIGLVGNVRVEGEDAPLIGNGFTLTITREVLESADCTAFLSSNDFTRHSSLIPDGLSMRIQVEFSCALRNGSEGVDLRSAAEKFITNLDQLTFASTNKGILLRKNSSKAAKNIKKLPWTSFLTELHSIRIFYSSKHFVA